MSFLVDNPLLLLPANNPNRDRSWKESDCLTKMWHNVYFYEMYVSLCQHHQLKTMYRHNIYVCITKCFKVLAQSFELATQVTCGHNVVGTGWGGSCSWRSSGSRGSLPLRDFRILATDLGVGNIQFKMSKKNV